jgi:hypothetical protein
VVVEEGLQGAEVVFLNQQGQKLLFSLNKQSFFMRTFWGFNRSSSYLCFVRTKRNNLNLFVNHPKLLKS